MDTTWDEALTKALQYNLARTKQRQKMQDPWHRALLSCITAQRIRHARHKGSQRKTSKTKSNKHQEWDAALKAALVDLKTKYKERQTESDWTYALKIRVTGWNLRSKNL